ncbi:D-alanyl-D-alanine endopeptidase [Usitatibacter rugosus]|uniref:D-alanyl-D-alanine endopeptidase n=1 Tax=Usitatibacter rugosus TaxID=2732067 RepID=UPI001FE8131D|nr:D-alanyl-D-alanine endopeptidase [Usitatibacter rugosus]
MTRLIALLTAALVSLGAAAAADKPAVAKTRAVKASALKAELTAEGEPNLASSAVMVFDPQTGRTLYSKNADEAHPIASITKLMTAMIVLDSKLDLEEPIALSNDDIDTLKGTKSKLPLGTHFRRDDLLRIALVASDNRAASALGRSYPGGLPAFVDAMNAKAKALGLGNTTFVDSSGLNPGNVSSPQDLAKLVSAASSYPLIREYSTTPALDVTLPNSKRKIGFVNTNALVRASDWQIGLSKTGYINEAGKCLVMHAMIANQPIVIVLLDSWGKLTRIGDANRIRKWLEKNPGKLALSPG